MKKHTLTKQDIQKELLSKLNKVKGISIFLTAIIIVGLVFYPMHIINYLRGTPFDYTGGFRSPDLTPKTAMFVIPILLLIFIVFVLFLYYIDLYKIKRGKFEITKEKLCQKGQETVRYGTRYSRKEENAFYFHCGRVTVEKKVYSYSNIGDVFYIVRIKSKLFSKRYPDLVYNTKYYEINDN